MSTVPKASNFFVACFKIGILKYIFKSLEDCMGISQNKFHSEDVFTHSMVAGDSISCKHPLLKLATYLHDIGKPQTKQWNHENRDFQFLRHENDGAVIIKKELTNLSFSNSEFSFITDLIENHMSFQLSTPKATRKTLRRINGKMTICEMIRFKIADRKAKFLNGVNTPLEIFMIKDMIGKIEDVLIKKEPFNLKDLAIDGFDVMNTLKIKPGPIVGVMLERLFEKVIEDPELNTKEKLLDLLLDEIPY
jgi:putative nucleotidyltransferase with HDIG domain